MLIFQRAQTSTDPHTFRHEFPPPVRGRHKIKTISVRPGLNEEERKGGSTSKRSNNYGTVIISSLTFSFNRRHANSSGQLCRSEGGFPPKTNGRTALTTARGPFRGKIYENDSTLYNPCSSKKYPPTRPARIRGPRLVLCLNNPPGDFIGLSGQCCLWSGWIVQVWSRRLGDVGQR